MYIIITQILYAQAFQMYLQMLFFAKNKTKTSNSVTKDDN